MEGNRRDCRFQTRAARVYRARAGRREAIGGALAGIRHLAIASGIGQDICRTSGPFSASLGLEWYYAYESPGRKPTIAGLLPTAHVETVGFGLDIPPWSVIVKCRQYVEPDGQPGPNAAVRTELGPDTSADGSVWAALIECDGANLATPMRDGRDVVVFGGLWVIPPGAIKGLVKYIVLPHRWHNLVTDPERCDFGAYAPSDRFHAMAPVRPAGQTLPVAVVECTLVQDPAALTRMAEELHGPLPPNTAQ